MSKRNFRGQVFSRPTNVLKSAEKQAISIRKLLLKKGEAIGQRAWGELDDAVKLAVTIEAIASKASNLPAEEANNSVELLELLFVQLDEMLTRLLAS